MKSAKIVNDEIHIPIKVLIGKFKKAVMDMGTDDYYEPYICDIIGDEVQRIQNKYQAYQSPDSEAVFRGFYTAAPFLFKPKQENKRIGWFIFQWLKDDFVNFFDDEMSINDVPESEARIRILKMIEILYPAAVIKIKLEEY